MGHSLEPINYGINVARQATESTGSLVGAMQKVIRQIREQHHIDQRQIKEIRTQAEAAIADLRIHSLGTVMRTRVEEVAQTVETIQRCEDMLARSSPNGTVDIRFQQSVDDILETLSRQTRFIYNDLSRSFGIDPED